MSGPEVVESFGETALEAAADFAGPADVHHALLQVEAEAGLFALEAVRVGDGVDVEVVEPRTQRLVDLRRPHAFA